MKEVLPHVNVGSNERIVAMEMTDEMLRQAVPAVFAEDRFAQTSERYQFISTLDVVQAMRGEGFVPVRAHQTAARSKDRRNFSRHMIVFRLPEFRLERYGDVAPEIILFNAHDGTSSYRLHAGIFRMICANGLVVSTGTLATFRVTHAGLNTAERVLEGSHRLVQGLPAVFAQIDGWKNHWMTERDQLSYAEEALKLRFGAYSPVRPSQVLNPRREDDTGEDLFTTFNVVQEHLMRGGLRGYTRNLRRTQTRPLVGIDAITRLNTALWDLTVQYGLN
jgi:hypothetical protein